MGLICHSGTQPKTEPWCEYSRVGHHFIVTRSGVTLHPMHTSQHQSKRLDTNFIPGYGDSTNPKTDPNAVDVTDS